MAKVTVKVVAVLDFDASQPEPVLTQEWMQNAPETSSQLSFCKGQCFELLNKDIKWWLFVRCIESQAEGFVPSICVVPIRMDLDFKTVCDLKKGAEVPVSMVNTQIDLTFFPNVPCESKRVPNRKPCPEESANIISRFTFWWLNRLIITGFKRPLLDSDLWSLGERNLSRNIVPKLQHEWNKELRKSQVKDEKMPRCQKQITENTQLQEPNPDVSFAKKKSYEPSLARALMRVFAPYFLVGTVFKLCNDILLFIQPYLLGRLIEYTEDKGNDADRWKGYVYVLCMVVVAMLQMAAVQNGVHISFTSAMRVHTSITGTVYAKALSLSNISRRLSTAGEMLNLMAVDAQRVMNLVRSLNQLWSAPLQICVAMYFLYVTMGVSVLAGVGVLLLLVLLNLLITRFIRKTQVLL